MFTKLSVIALTVFFALFAQATAEQNIKCDGQPLKESKELEEARKTCFTKYAPADETDQTKQAQAVYANQCFHLCIFQNKGAFDSTGKFNEEGAQTAANKFYPTDDLAKKMIEGSKTCAQTAGAIDKPISMDDNCSAFKPLMECITKTHMEVCKIQSKEDAYKSE